MSKNCGDKLPLKISWSQRVLAAASCSVVVGTNFMIWKWDPCLPCQKVFETMCPISEEHSKHIMREILSLAHCSWPL